MASEDEQALTRKSVGMASEQPLGQVLRMVRRQPGLSPSGPSAGPRSGGERYRSSQNVSTRPGSEDTTLAGVARDGYSATWAGGR
mgnify:CR=1 FL=1